MFVTRNSCCMKILLLSLFLLSSAASMAQEKNRIAHNVGERYMGLSQGYGGNERIMVNGSLMKWAEPISTSTSFVYGRRLRPYIYLETGLSYSFHSDNRQITSIAGNVRSSKTVLESVHGFGIPISFLFRSGGEKWRITAGIPLAAVAVGMTTNNIITPPTLTSPLESDVDRSFGVAIGIGLGIQAGLEYQIAPEWMFRTNLGLGLSGLNPKDFGYTPSLSFGLFKSIVR